MRRINRNFIFSVLRDPCLRVFSRYTYFAQRAEMAAFRDVPEVRRFAGLSFAAAAAELTPNTMARLLIRDHLGPGRFARLAALPPGSPLSAADLGAIDAALKRFDRIYAGPLDRIAADVAAMAGVPVPPVQRVRDSRSSGEIEIGCGEEEFRALLFAHTWLDAVVMDRARALFGAFIPEGPMTPTRRSSGSARAIACAFRPAPGGEGRFSPSQGRGRVAC